MKYFLLVCKWALALFFLASATGCFNKQPKDSQMPWSRPAEWENRIPGFGGPGSGFGY